MRHSEDLINLIHAEVLRVLHRTTRRTPVVVDGYDKKTHSVRLKLMPESTEQKPVLTGWIPLHTMQSGNKRGWFSPPNVGDHGWLEFHDDDREAGTFTHAAFNDKFPPDDTVDAGELKYIHPGTETQIYFKKDGSITIRGQKTNSQDNSKQMLVFGADGSIMMQDKSGNAKLKLDGSGNIIMDAATWTAVASGPAGIKGSNVELFASGTLGLDGQQIIAGGKGAVSDGSVDPPQDQPLIDPWKVIG